MKPAAVASPRFLLATMAASVLAVVVLLGGLQFAFGKLGLLPQQAVWLFIAAALGSAINLPVFSVAANAADFGAPDAKRRDISGERPSPAVQPPGKMVVAVNLGGCVVPLAFSLFLVGHAGIALPQLLAACLLIGFFAYCSSTLIPGVGVIMPMLAVPLAAALLALALDATNAAPLAYVSATLAVLFGADIARLRARGRGGESAVAIGSAGCFDGILLAGILAVAIV